MSFFDGKLDVIISDMAANTTGNKSLDCIRTNQLGLEVVNFSTSILKNSGSVVVKLFMGEDFLSVKKPLKKNLKKSSFLNLNQVEENQKKLIYIVRY